MTKLFVKEFARDNQKAMLFLMSATFDYSGARCCLLNGLLSGLVLAAQATEKYLKALIIFSDKTKQPRSFIHKLPELAVEAEKLGLDFFPYSETIENLKQHYNSRYPDNQEKSRLQSSDELGSIDDLIIYINESLPIPNEVKLRCGLYACVSASQITKGSIMPDEHWIKLHNKALEPILERILADQDALSKSWKELAKI